MMKRNAQHENVTIICDKVKALEYGNLSGCIKYLFELMREALIRMYVAHRVKSFMVSITLMSLAAITKNNAEAVQA